MGLGKYSHLHDEIYVTDPGGRLRVRLTSKTVMDYHPVWSPDGSRIAFLRSDGEACWFKCPTEKRASSQISVMNAHGTGVTRLTHN
jgi:Tol biopolymer transport system component